MDLDNTVLTQIKSELAINLGLDPDDIDIDDTFLQDLHMRPPEFSDFLEALNEKGFDISSLDLTTIKTVGDLVEALSSSEYIE